MIAKSGKRFARIIRYESLDDMPPPKPLNKRLRDMSDEEAERRAAADPDAGIIPPGFWDNARVWMPERKQQITLRLDPDVIRWFKRTGKGYQSRMGAVLRSYVQAKRKRSA
ncbi:MAG TPA: BrnA antitoxin family protein [Xanthobacteraceae bacterium]|nr:BrnA antitoxin family protein [Xanthobacteraceae bacterium]